MVSASESAYAAAMASSALTINLPAGWQCDVALTQNADGAFFGKAELRQGREARCVFVIAQQPSREAARARLQLRAGHLIQEWEARATSEQGS